MTSSCSDSRLAFATGDVRPATTTGDLAMTEHRVIERETITDDGLERPRTIEKDYVSGAPHGDEEAGGAVAGGVAGAVVGAVVGGPVGAVVGGAIGAVTGVTAGAIDQKDKDDTVVVTREVRRS
jgi:uncharacterized protein YcfJ